MADTPTPEPISGKASKAVEGIRGPFVDYVKGFTALAVDRAALAPKFMKACDVFKSETGGSFVDFVRALDGSVPKDQASYLKHRTYQAADYLRRLVAQAAGRPTTNGQGTNASTPLDGFARLTALVVGLLPEPERPRVWNLIGTELGWTPNQVSRLQRLVESVEPLMALRLPKGQQLPMLKVTAPPAAKAHAA